MGLLYRIWGLRKIALLIENFFFHVQFKKHFGNSVKVLGFPIVSMHTNSKISIGKNVVLISHSYFSQPGVNHPVMLRTMRSGAILTIGDDVGMSGGGVCVHTEVTIGNQVMLGANAFITDTDFHPINPANRRYSGEGIQSKKVVIEDNVFIGMNTLVLKGVTIGKNSVIGANSLVAKDVPANQIWAGNPAKFIKTL